ncbi:hypothetical protein LINPERHAP2_LOCUS21348 [Linum perenne]
MRLTKEYASSFGVPLRPNERLIWCHGTVSASRKKMEVWD